MKITVNYDLIEEAAVAKKGFSLNRYVKRVVGSGAIIAAFEFPFVALMLGPEEIDFFFFHACRTYSIFWALYYGLYHSKEKERAMEELETLTSRLQDIYVNTNANMLMEAYPYKKEYRVDWDRTMPRIEERKYIMVPVNNDWGNNERSLLQEHIIGSRGYCLSCSEPEKGKVYFRSPKHAI